MNTRIQNLNRLIDTRFNRSIKEFASAINKDPSQVSQWRGGHRNLGDAAARNIEIALNLELGYMDRKVVQVESVPTVGGKIPVISYVQAGDFSEAIDIYEAGYAEQWIPKYSGGDHVFALRVDGNSMTSNTGKSFPEGMLIHVDPDAVCCNNGDFVVARRIDTDQVTFKQYKTSEGQPYLHPLNPDYPDIHDPFEIIGKVIFAGWDL